MLLLVAIASVLCGVALGFLYLIRACVVAVLMLIEWIEGVLRGN